MQIDVATLDGILRQLLVTERSEVACPIRAKQLLVEIHVCSSYCLWVLLLVALVDVIRSCSESISVTAKLFVYDYVSN